MRWLSGMVVALGGCSLIYNPNNLPGATGEAGIDAIPDAAPVLDANPSQLELIDVQPAVIEEGQGDGGSAPALLVIRGHQIVDAHLEVVLRPPPGVTVRLDPVGDARASHDGDYLAFTVTSHVDRTLASDVALEVEVTQDVPAQYGGGTARKTLSGKLTLRGLPELLSSSPGVDMAGKRVTVPLATARYSQVDLRDISPTAFAGTARAEITAVANILLGDVHADAPSATTAGPGGFPGGSTAGQGPGGGGHGGDATISS